MLSFYKPLYTDVSLADRADRICRMLARGKTDTGCYVITLASNGTDHLDIISSLFLKQSLLRESLPMVVGVASSKKEALGLVQKITDDCLRETGGTDIRSWLTEKCRS